MSGPTYFTAGDTAAEAVESREESWYIGPQSD
jgi:hypothetical protein